MKSACFKTLTHYMHKEIEGSHENELEWPLSRHIFEKYDCNEDQRFPTILPAQTPLK
jgi:hypothetical protein